MSKYFKSSKHSADLRRIISEPGDATRYDFCVFREHDTFFITPYSSTFPYPQKLNKYDIVRAIEKFENGGGIDKEVLNTLEVQGAVNPHTAIQTAIAIYQEYKEVF